MKSKKGIFFQIIARRWFDKVNGNTYHSVAVYANNSLVGECPFEYGYGDGYLQTAAKILLKAGYFHGKGKPGHKYYDEYSEFQTYWRKNRNKVLVNVTDVSRKKDL